MRGFVATVGLGSLLILSASGSIAFADNASFRFANNTPETIYVKLHSEARAGWKWPDARKSWILNPGQKALWRQEPVKQTKKSTLAPTTRIAPDLGG